MGIETTAWALGGRPCLRPSDGYRGAARANSYTCPIGPAFGRAWVLMRRRDLEAMKKKGELDGPLSLDVASGKRALHFPRLYFVKGVNVSGGPKNSRDAAYLCELVDVRWAMARSAPLSLRVNVVKQLGGEDYNEVAVGDGFGSADVGHHSRYVHGTTKFGEDNLPSEAYTWGDLFSTVWRYVVNSPVFGEGDPYVEPELPWVPAGVPENYVATAANRWKFYNDLLAKFSWALAYNPVADDFSIVEMGKKQPGLEKAEARLVPRWDADPVEPEFVIGAKRFLALAKQQAPHHGLQDLEYWRTMAAVHIREFGPGSTSGYVTENGFFERGKKKYKRDAWGLPISRTLWDQGPAPYETYPSAVSDEAVTRLSLAEQNASRRFTQIVNALVQDEATPLARRVYSGIVPTFMPGSRVKCMAWRQTAADGVVTEVIQHPGLPRLDADGEWLGVAEPQEEFRAPDLPGVPTTHVFALVNYDNGPAGTTSSGGHSRDRGPAQGWHKSYKNSGYFLATIVMWNPIANEMNTSEISNQDADADRRYYKPSRRFSPEVGAAGNFAYQRTQLCWVHCVDCPTAPLFVRGGTNYSLSGPLELSYVGHGRLSGSHTIDGSTLPLLLARNDCDQAPGTVVLASGNAYWVLLAGGGSVVVRANAWHVGWSTGTQSAGTGIVNRYLAGDRVWVSRIGCAWYIVNGVMPGRCGEGNLVEMCVGEPGRDALGGNEDEWDGVVIGPDGEAVIPDGGGGVFEEGTEVLEGGEFEEGIGP